MDPLQDILALERDIAVRLDAERTKAAHWLEQATREIDEAAQADAARLKASAAAEEAAAQAAAVEQAAAIVQQAHALAARAEQPGEDRLAPIVWKHLVAIVPGTAP